MSENSADTTHDKGGKSERPRIVRVVKILSLIWIAFVFWATVFSDYLPVGNARSKVYIFIFVWWPIAALLYFAARKLN